MSCNCHGFGDGAPPMPRWITNPDEGPEYRPTELWLSANKWWLIGGGVGLFLLAGGSILGLSLRKRRRRR